MSCIKSRLSPILLLPETACWRIRRMRLLSWTGPPWDLCLPKTSSTNWEALCCPSLPRGSRKSKPWHVAPVPMKMHLKVCIVCCIYGCYFLVVECGYRINVVWLDHLLNFSQHSGFGPLDFYIQMTKGICVSPQKLFLTSHFSAVFIRWQNLMRGGKVHSEEELESCMRNSLPGSPSNLSILSFKVWSNVVNSLVVLSAHE